MSVEEKEREGGRGAVAVLPPPPLVPHLLNYEICGGGNKLDHIHTMANKEGYVVCRISGVITP